MKEPTKAGNSTKHKKKRIIEVIITFAVRKRPTYEAEPIGNLVLFTPDGFSLRDTMKMLKAANAVFIDRLSEEEKIQFGLIVPGGRKLW